jgi:complement component 1 Q subcomponent-binding protein
VIEVDLDNQPDGSEDIELGEDGEDGEDADEDAVPVKFRVSISKGTSALIFECESDGEYVGINHIAQEPGVPGDGAEEAGEDEDDGTQVYSGPVFEELDDTLQQAFLDYLEERGITSELGAYLRIMSVDKMAQEYQAWLSRVKDFVSL